MDTPTEPVEQAIALDCEGDRLVAMLTPSESEEARVGVVIVVGGPQYRVGSHRQFVSLARYLARAGFPTLRFDYRGMGDSTGERRTFEDIEHDVKCAIDALLDIRRDVSSVVLWGLCDAASAVAMYAPTDARVVGVVLANPWVRNETTFAQAQLRHYYAKRLASGDFWKKAARGALRLAPSLRQFVRSLSASTTSTPLHREDFRERMLSGLHRFSRPVLLLLSGQDLTAREFVDFAAKRPLWQQCMEHVATVPLPESDHTFSRPEDQRRVEELTASWVASVLSAMEPAASVAESRPLAFQRPGSSQV